MPLESFGRISELINTDLSDSLPPTEFVKVAVEEIRVPTVMCPADDTARSETRQRDDALGLSILTQAGSESIPHHLDRRAPVLISQYLKTVFSPESGYGVVATQDIPYGTRILTCPGPVAYSISRNYRKEVCAWCFAYEDGKFLKVKFELDGKGLDTPVPSAGVSHGHNSEHPTSPPSSSGSATNVAILNIPLNSGGLVFCSIKCREEWENEYGAVGKQAFMALENLMQKKEKKKHGSHIKSLDFDDVYREPTSAEVEEAWKKANEQAALIRQYRLAMATDVCFPVEQTSENTQKTHRNSSDKVSAADKEDIPSITICSPSPKDRQSGNLPALSSPKSHLGSKAQRRAVANAQNDALPDDITYDMLYYFLMAALTCYSQTQRANQIAVAEILNGKSYTKKSFTPGVDVPPNLFSELFSLFPQLPAYGSVHNLKNTIATFLAIISLDGLPASLLLGCTCGADPALMGNVPCMDFISREVIEASKTRDVHNSFGLREFDDLDASQHAEKMKAFEEEYSKSGESKSKKGDDSMDVDEDSTDTNTTVSSREYVYFGSGTWTSASFFNHSCSENVSRRREGRAWVFEACPPDPTLVANNSIEYDASRQFIPAGKDLCISYIRHLTHSPLGSRQSSLRSWGFQCKCELCLVQSTESMNLGRKETVSEE